jgi:hypothetical protein
MKKLLQYTPKSKEGLALTDAAGGELSAAAPRRWVRGALESCVHSMRRSPRLLTNYVAQYKLADPQWQPILALPVGNPVALELRARHANVALRHLVQKGHAVYVITDTSHSVLRPRGLAERSYVTCSMAKSQQRLLTHLIHEGPLDAADPAGPRGVVAMSNVCSTALAFNRKYMLVERSRRVGSLQSQLGAYDWTTHHPEEVGRASEAEVMLLQSTTRVLGGSVAATGIVSSHNVAQHPYQFVTDFEAPINCVMDAFHQAAFYSARHHDLVGEKEALHAVAWVTKTHFPYSPVELDLPFKLQLGQPQVHDSRETYPSGLVGSPFVDGCPVIMNELSLRQGTPEYLYDQGPASRPLKFWSQMDATPLTGHMFFVRDGNAEQLRAFEDIVDPFAVAPADEAAASFKAMGFRGKKPSLWNEPSAAGLTRKARADAAVARIRKAPAAAAAAAKGKKAPKQKTAAK